MSIVSKDHKIIHRDAYKIYAFSSQNFSHTTTLSIILIGKKHYQVENFNMIALRSKDI